MLGRKYGSLGNFRDLLKDISREVEKFDQRFQQSEFERKVCLEGVNEDDVETIKSDPNSGGKVLLETKIIEEYPISAKEIARGENRSCGNVSEVGNNVDSVSELKYKSSVNGTKEYKHVAEESNKRFKKYENAHVGKNNQPEGFDAEGKCKIAQEGVRKSGVYPKK